VLRSAFAADPQRWSADVLLNDGGTVHVRPVRPEDGPLVAAFHARQSPESIYYRYFTARPQLSERELEHLTVVDGRDRLAFVALLGDDLVGIARYDRWPGRNEAEVAFFVDDAHHRRGIGILLLEYLAAAGREQGFERFTAQVLPTNRKMISVFQEVGFEVTSRFEDGVIEVSLGLAATEAARERIDARARRSEARSVQRLLAPTSVVVVGAGRNPGTFGHEVLRQILAHDFQGVVHPVNRDATHVAGLPAYASVLDVPEEIGLAIIAVPADEVAEVVDQCGRRRVQALIIGSAPTPGADPALTSGIISALRRTILADPSGTPTRHDMIQTDAPLDPSATGGALLDARGTVVGITTDPPDGVAVEGLSYATPIDTALAVADQIITTGSAHHPWLGIEGSDIEARTADDLQLAGGAMVATVTEASPAAAAGLAPNDVIISVGDVTVTSMADLVVELRDHFPGEIVLITYVRDGRLGIGIATLGEVG